jgi:2'-5' RNA ligase
MIRTFIGVKIDIAEDLRNAVSDLKKNFKNENIRWADFNNLHVTLAFIGNTETELVKNIIIMLKERFAGTGTLGFTITGLGIFKNIKDPKVIYSGIENCEKLIQAHESVKTGLEALGIRLEDRQFNPHLTIGRIKSLENRKTLQDLIIKYSGKELQSVTINEIIFYESVLLPTGPIYKPILKVML